MGTGTAHEPVGASPEQGEDIEERKRPAALVLHEAIRLEGEHELERPAAALFWSALSAGLSMGFSLIAMAVLHAALPEAKWSALLVSAGYPIGFLIVIMGRQQLFTENTLTPVLPLLQKPELPVLARVLRLWAIVLVGNVLGAALISALLSRTDVLPDDVRASCLALGQKALEGSAGVHLLRAFLAGWLIALLVWVLPNAEQSRVALIVLFTFVVGAAELAHVVAGSVEVSFVVVSGEASVREAALRFFVPTLVGNVIGGVSLVAGLSHVQVRADRAA